MTTRTQDEILARFREAASDPDDMFGWRREVLAASMTNGTIAQAIPDLDAETIAAVAKEQISPERTEVEAQMYLDFAVGKILNHRGISASRSVQKLTEYAWLLGRDDVVKAMGEAEHAQYGAPIVRAFAEGMGWPFHEHKSIPDQAALDRMSRGQLCVDDCDEGCGQ